jgi:hypothetical protein
VAIEVRSALTGSRASGRKRQNCLVQLWGVVNVVRRNFGLDVAGVWELHLWRELLSVIDRSVEPYRNLVG